MCREAVLPEREGMKATPFSVDDFSGGITDNYIGGDPKSAMTMDNWTITSNKKIKSRPGWTTGHGITNPQLPDGAVAIRDLYQLTYMISRYTRKLYTYSTTLTEVPSPASYSAFDSVTNNGSWVNKGEWKDHLYLVASSYSRPVKIYTNVTSSTIKLLAALAFKFLV